MWVHGKEPFCLGIGVRSRKKYALELSILDIRTIMVNVKILAKLIACFSSSCKNTSRHGFCKYMLAIDTPVSVVSIKGSGVYPEANDPRD